jgi:peptide/nickel transport system substrate-binding protein
MKTIHWLISLVLIASVLAACSTSEPEVVEKEVTRVVTETVIETVKETVVVAGTPQTIEQQVTRVVEVEKVVTATPEPEPQPTVGGALVYPLQTEPDSLDVHKASGFSFAVLQYIGASLITIDPATQEFVPYLAESWTVSPDGLTLEFKLRQDVKFHDGSPLTAEDYAWTISRALDPATAAVTAATILRGVASAEAVDDYTLRIHMAYPNFPILFNMSNPIYTQPLSKAYFERVGEQEFGRNPVGVGPFKFKEWIRGEKIVLERNPDFSWGPAYTHGGPAYIETIELLVIPEYATIMAGLEAREITHAWIQTNDVKRIKEGDQFEVFERLVQGISPMIVLNNGKPPFDDVRVRQAFSLAVDRRVLIDVVLQGGGQIQYGPISPSVRGYWPGVEYIGYGYDLEQAKALMAEAGYTAGADGILEKDGEPLRLTLKAPAAAPEHVKVATILQEQYKALGVEVTLQQEEGGVMGAEMLAGDFNFAVYGVGWADSSLLFALFHSSMIGGMNSSFVNDPQLDALLAQMLFTADPKVNASAGNDAQRYIVEQALVIPLYTSVRYLAVDSAVQGVLPIDTFIVELFDAYIVK